MCVENVEVSIFRLVIREAQYARRDDNAVLLMDKVEHRTN